MNPDELEETLLMQTRFISAGALTPSRMEQLRYASLLLSRLGETPEIPCLVVESLPGTVVGFQFADGCVVGRNDQADQIFDFEELSARHFALRVYGEGDVEIEDLNSSNGTFVNQTRIEGRHPLTSGDVIEAGGHLFVYLN